MNKHKMNLLCLEVVQVYTDNNVITNDLIYRIVVQNQDQAEKKIKDILNGFIDVKMYKESEKPNEIKYFYRVRNYDGLYYNLGFNYASYEL